jgi:pre-mRNA-processing factor 6
MYARYEESRNQLNISRSILDRARVINSKNELLWLESVRLEVRADKNDVAKALMAKALQECPHSGVLWAESIWLEPRPARKSKSVDAHKNAEGDAYVFNSVAKLFESERKIDKARSWYTKAVKTKPDIGDFWVDLYKFELQYGTIEQQEAILMNIDKSDPRHGEVWQVYLKDDNQRGKKASELLKMIEIVN